jgi:hypothetical protein
MNVGWSVALKTPEMRLAANTSPFIRMILSL